MRSHSGSESELSDVDESSVLGAHLKTGFDLTSLDKLPLAVVVDGRSSAGLTESAELGCELLYEKRNDDFFDTGVIGELEAFWFKSSILR